jgi:hypothetical protein
MESNISHPGNNKGSSLENTYYHILEETNISVSDIGIVHPGNPKTSPHSSLPIRDTIRLLVPSRRYTPSSGILERILALGGRPQSPALW